ncbi:MAG: YdbH domain-containing protein, partial [Alphaproteobacteria bacterium]|nr:YdbH domain-containing protein [Alphaproteobacteria bacterium]
KSQMLSDMQLLLQDMSFTYGGMKVANINTVIDITNPFPFETAKSQLIHADMFDMAIPIENAMVLFHIDGQNQLVIENVALSIAGGALNIENGIVPLDKKDSKLVLNVSDVDLNALSQIINLENFQATGLVSGRIPLSISSKEISIINGKLWTTDTGTIKYLPDVKPSAKSLQTLLDALENFQYKKMDIEIEGSTSGKTNIKLHLKGKNPDLYKGRSIELNTNLQGNIAKLIKRKLKQFAIPAQITERIKQFQQ